MKTSLFARPVQDVLLPAHRGDCPAVPSSRLSRRGDAAHSMMLSRVLPESGVSRLDVAAFNSSI